MAHLDFAVGILVVSVKALHHGIVDLKFSFKLVGCFDGVAVTDGEALNGLQIGVKVFLFVVLELELEVPELVDDALAAADNGVDVRNPMDLESEGVALFEEFENEVFLDLVLVEP